MEEGNTNAFINIIIVQYGEWKKGTPLHDRLSLSLFVS